MEEEEREAYLIAINESGNVYFNNNFVPFESCKITHNRREREVALVGHENVRLNGDEEDEIVAIRELNDEAIVLIAQMMNYMIIKETSSIVLPETNDVLTVLETGREYSYNLYEVDFDMTFEEYQEAMELDVGDYIDGYATFAEALVQQKNMVT